MTLQWPIRWRLTLWYGLLLAAGILLAGTAIYIALRIILYNDFEERVHAQATLAVAAVRSDADGLSIDAEALERWQEDDNFIRLVDPAGAIVLDTSPVVGELPLDEARFEAALSGDTTYALTSMNGETYGVVSAPVTEGDVIAGVAQVGLSRVDEDDLLRLVLLLMGVTLPVAVIAAAVGGYVLAGRALGPVAGMTAMAERISASDLHQRIVLDLADDEIGRLAATFNAMLERIEAGFERQKRFTGDAAHELRTPLSTLRGQIELALSQPRSTAEYRQALSAVRDDLERLSEIVRSLLMLARAEAGTLQLERERFDLGATVNSVIERYRPQAETRGVTVVDASQAMMVSGDQDLVVQVLVNLFDNALAHTPDGGEIEAGNDSDETEARCWVQDSGSGIPLDQLGKVFEPFYRLDAGRSRQSGGTGLGLSISKVIIEAHGGSISASLGPEGGARFEFRLPR